MNLIIRHLKPLLGKSFSTLHLLKSIDWCIEQLTVDVVDDLIEEEVPLRIVSKAVDIHISEGCLARLGCVDDAFVKRLIEGFDKTVTGTSIDELIHLIAGLYSLLTGA